MYKCSYWFQADFTLSLLQAALVTSCSVITMTGYQATLIYNNHDWISGYTPQSLARPCLATSPVLLASHDITGTAGVPLAVTSLARVLCILGMPTFPTTWVCSRLLLVILMSKLLLRKFMIPFMTRIGVLRKLESPRLLVAWKGKPWGRICLPAGHSLPLTPLCVMTNTKEQVESMWLFIIQLFCEVSWCL